MRGQGGFEYLLMVAAVVGAAAVALILITGSSGTNKEHADFVSCKSALENVHNQDVLFGKTPPAASDECRKLCQPFGDTGYCGGGVTPMVIQEFVETRRMPVKAIG